MRLLLGLPTGAVSFDRLVALVRRAEDAGVHAVTIGDPRWPDQPGGEGAAIAFEPITLAAALAVRTSRIGIIATAGPDVAPPYNLARRFASLDVISRGRGGWLLPTGNCADAGRAAEYLAVVAGLWRSWDGDALVRDKARGRFFDPSKMRILAHRGEHFAVRGPLNVARSPQGSPIIAVTHRPGDEPTLTARFADLILADEGVTDDELDAALAAAGRSGRAVVTSACATSLDLERLEPRLRSGAYGGLHLRLHEPSEAIHLLERTLAELTRRRLVDRAPDGATLRARLGIAGPPR